MENQDDIDKSKPEADISEISSTTVSAPQNYTSEKDIVPDNYFPEVPFDNEDENEEEEDSDNEDDSEDIDEDNDGDDEDHDDVEKHKKKKKNKKNKAKKNKHSDKEGELKKKYYEKELLRLQTELVKMQEWIRHKGMRVVIIFEGRDAAGKGGVIKSITQYLNPRSCRIVALGVPTEKEKTQWYFQRYIEHLPSAGEMVMFDRSWYNRAGVERVMGFCTEEQYWEFLSACPALERMLIHSGLILIKYWFSVSFEEQEKRFQARIDHTIKRWKLSPMDLQSRDKWLEYSKAKDEMFAYTDTKHSPWYVVQSDDKRRAHLNCISHLLSQIPYEDLTPTPIELPKRKDMKGYVRPPITDQTFVPDKY